MTIDIEKLAREAGAEPDNDFAGYWLAHPNHLRDLCESYHRQKLEGAGVEPVAMRGDFDGYGYQFIDNGSGSDWCERHPDWEMLVPASTVAALQERIRQLEADAKLRPISEFGELQNALERIKVLEAALEALADYTDERIGDNECRPLENARAAIARARGEQHG